MTTTTNNNSSELIDGLRVGVQAFTSLWAALRTNYEGTNITKTIARLLNMYQSEDGIKAYERLLRTLCVILEDFDENGRRLLTSMVPLPKGSSDDDIKNIFFLSTGFVRLNAPSYQPSDLQESTNQSMSQDQLRNFLSSDNVDSSHKQKVQRSNHLIQNNNPQMFSNQHFNDRQQDTMNSSAGYKLNRHQSSAYLMQHSGYSDCIVKTLDNKYYRVPVPSMNYYRPYQMLQQERQSMIHEKNLTTKNTIIENNSLKLQNLENINDINKIENNIDDKKIDNDTKDIKIIDEKINKENKNNTAVINNNQNDKNKIGKNNYKITKKLTACIDRFLKRAKNNNANDLSSMKNKNSSFIRKRKNSGLNNQSLFLMQPSLNDIAYKKLYYDNLISIQQAKLAKDCNPYLRSAEYLQLQLQQQQQQQHWYYQQQQHHHQHQQQQQQRMAMELGLPYAHRLFQPDYQYRAMNIYGGIRYHPGMYDPSMMFHTRQNPTANIYRNKNDEHNGAKRQKIDATTKRQEKDFTRS